MAKFKGLTGFEIAGMVVAVIVLLVGLTALGGWLFYLGWNHVAVPAFGAPALTFFQSWLGWFVLGAVGSLFKSQTRVEK